MFAERKGIERRSKELQFAALRCVKNKGVTPSLHLEPHQQAQERGKNALIYLAIFMHNLASVLCMCFFLMLASVNFVRFMTCQGHKSKQHNMQSMGSRTREETVLTKSLTGSRLEGQRSKAKTSNATTR
jgi:hypothetical protein